MSAWIGLGSLFFASLSALIGCALLAVSQERNSRKVQGEPMQKKSAKIARSAGCAVLCAAFVFCLISEGVSFAVLLWPLLLTVGAFLTTMVLAYRPSLLKPLTVFLSF